MEITFTAGKGNHLVSSLVPGDCVKALYLLCDATVRNSVEVSKQNTYIFANTENSIKHVTGWDATQHMCKGANITCPDVNAKAKRIRISTLYASLDVPTDERNYFKFTDTSAIPLK